MKDSTYDAIVKGTGQAGPPMARRLASSGWNVAVVERGLFGGTCVNTGCIPTKAMVSSAHAAYLACRASEFGIDIPGSTSVNMKKIKARKDLIAGECRQR